MANVYLVTGGAGFIGSNLARRILEEGHRVRVLDNFSTGREQNLDSVRSDIELVHGDIRDTALVQKCMQGAEVVFHEAALPSVPRSVEDPFQSHDNNITGTLNVLIAARDNRVRRLVFASSSSVYGDNPVLPKTEKMPPSLLSPYALNKLTGEYYCKLFSSVYKLETISLRYFNVFGPRQNPESDYAAVIPKFIAAFLHDKRPVIYGDGEQTRDFTYIDNVVEANLMAAHIPHSSGEVLNVATGERISLNQLISSLQGLTGKKIAPKYAEARIGDVLHSLADISQAHSFLGYSPKVDFGSGLQKTLDWFSEST